RRDGPAGLDDALHVSGLALAAHRRDDTLVSDHAALPAGAVWRLEWRNPRHHGRIGRGAATAGLSLGGPAVSFRPDSKKAPTMDLSFSPEEEAFRADVRAFIADARSELPKNMGAPEAATRTKEDCLAWHKLLYKKGWVAPAWPKEFGGTGWTVTQRYIFNE